MGSACEVGSGNVFADLGLADADELKTKVQLGVAIRHEIVARGWLQAQAADVLGIEQTKISALLRYRLDGFSVERLMSFLTALGHDVDQAAKIRSPAMNRARGAPKGAAARFPGRRA